MPGLHTVQPREMQYDGAFHGVIDLYDKNTSISLTEAWRLGVRGIIHQTSLGLFREDASYKDRKDHAMRMGFLWGAYHVVSNEDAGKQLDRFLSHEPGDPNVLMAVDWEETSKGVMGVPKLRQFVSAFRERLGFWPVLYGGHHIREAREFQKGDPVMGKCPLWYIRIDESMTPDTLDFPRTTWSDFALWQFATERASKARPYPRDVLQGADFSLFEGTESELRKSWPFRAA
jgi:GH25 family lysozyme M1 (1,4-beta-N-acetylmuramidase)